jgi:hypothetical protein
VTVPRLVSPSREDAAARDGAEVRHSREERTATPVQPEEKSASEHAEAFDAHAAAALADTCGASGLARALGVSETLVRDWKSPDSPKHFPAWALIRAREVAPDFVTALEARLATTAQSPTVSIESLLRRQTSINGLVANELDRGLADGVLDESERRNIARLSGQLARAALALQARAESDT